MTRSSRTALLALLLALPASADIIRVLDDPHDAMQARVDMIQQARSEIDAVYFLARNDRVTLTVLRSLRDARRRGVGRVRLIVDANFQHIPKGVLAHLSDEGVQVRVYHPLTLRHPSWIFRRMHEKFIVADGARYIAGGRNLAESYFDMAKRNFIDRDVYVDGTSAIDAQEHFDELWSSTDVADLDVHVSSDEKARASSLLETSSLAFDSACDWSAGQQNASSVQFLHDDITRSLEEMIAGAQTSIIIESPYVVPTQPVIELLEKKVAEGVRVQIVTNSIHSIDGALPYAGYLKYRRRLVLHGVDIREYKGPDTLHAKTVVIDGRTVFVGSYNLDPRSQNLNSEVMVVAEDETVAREVCASIEQHVDNAWKIAAHEHHLHIPAPRSWRIRAWAARLFLPFYERQL
jgi:phosphatidylserine/phosphatidylglycerophosphate/cardiolipin synthase-like enzyme